MPENVKIVGINTGPCFKDGTIAYACEIVDTYNPAFQHRWAKILLSHVKVAVRVPHGSQRISATIGKYNRVRLIPQLLYGVPKVVTMRQSERDPSPLSGPLARRYARNHPYR